MSSTKSAPEAPKSARGRNSPGTGNYANSLASSVQTYAKPVPRPVKQYKMKGAEDSDGVVFKTAQDSMVSEKISRTNSGSKKLRPKIRKKRIATLTQSEQTLADGLQELSMDDLKSLSDQLTAERAHKLQELQNAREGRKQLAAELQDTLRAMADEKSFGKNSMAKIREERSLVSGLLRKHKSLIAQYKYTRIMAAEKDQSELMHLSDSVEALQKQLDEARTLQRTLDELQQTQMDAEKLANVLKVHKLDLAMLRNDNFTAISKAKSHRDALLKALVQLQQELLSAKDERESRLRRMNKANEMHNRLQSDVKEEEEELLHREVAWLKDQMKHTHSAMESLEENAKDSTKPINVDINRRRPQSASVALGSSEDKAIEIRLQAMKAQINALDAQLSGKEFQTDNLNMNDVGTKRGSLEAELRELENKIALAEAKQSVSKAQETETKESIADDLDMLEDILEQAGGDPSQAVEAARQRNADLEAANKRLQIKVEVTQSELSKALQAANGARLDLEKQVENLEDKLHQEQTDKDAIAQFERERAAELVTAEKNLSVLKMKNEQMDESLQQAMDDLSQEQSEKALITHELLQQRSKANEMQKAIDELQLQLTSRQKSDEATRDELQRLQNETERVNSELKRVNNEKDQFQEQLNEVTKAKKSIEEEMARRPNSPESPPDYFHTLYMAVQSRNENAQKPYVTDEIANDLVEGWGLDSSVVEKYRWLIENALLSGLPVGWKEYKDSSNRPYFYEQAQEISTFIHPGAEFHRALLMKYKQSQSDLDSKAQEVMRQQEIASKQSKLLESERQNLEKMRQEVLNQEQQLKEQRLKSEVYAIEKEEELTAAAEMRKQQLENTQSLLLEQERERIREEERMKMMRQRDIMEKKIRREIEAEYASKFKNAPVSSTTPQANPKAAVESSNSTSSASTKSAPNQASSKKSSSPATKASEPNKSSSKSSANGKSGKASAGSEQGSRPSTATTHDPEYLKAAFLRKQLSSEEKEDLMAYAEYLGFGPEDKELLWVADLAMSAPLPRGWTEHTDEEGTTFFYNASANESSYEHPLDESFRAYFQRLKQGQKSSVPGRKPR